MKTKNMYQTYLIIIEAAEADIDRFWEAKSKEEKDRFWAEKDKNYVFKAYEVIYDAVAHHISARNFQDLCDEFVRICTNDGLERFLAAAKRR